MEAEGFYPDPYQLSDYSNVGIYPDNLTFKSKSFCPLVDSDDRGIKLISGETYEILVSSSENVNEVKVDVLCDTSGKAVVETVEDAVVDSGSNVGTTAYETITVSSTANKFKIRFKVLPVSAGKLAIAYFKNIQIRLNGSTGIYNLDGFYERVKIRYTYDGSTIWVKINGEWKQAISYVI